MMRIALHLRCSVRRLAPSVLESRLGGKTAARLGHEVARVAFIVLATGMVPLASAQEPFPRVEPDRESTPEPVEPAVSPFADPAPRAHADGSSGPSS